MPRDGGGLLTLRIFECTKPVIAAMNGSAVGIGVTMTLPMDIRVLADVGQGRLRVRRPRHRARSRARAGSCPRVVGINQALEWCLPPGCSGRTRRSRAGWCAASIRPTRCSAVARALAAEIAHARRAGLGRPDPPDAVAHARRRPPDGGAQDRLPAASSTRVGAPTPDRGRHRPSSRSARPVVDRQPEPRPARTGTRGGTERPYE